MTTKFDTNIINIILIKNIAQLKQKITFAIPFGEVGEWLNPPVC